MMEAIEWLDFNVEAERFTQGVNVRIKYTGQIVRLRRVSKYGVSIVSFCSGDECFISNRFLEPVTTVH